MLSVVLFLGTLFTLGQCGGDENGGQTDGILGVVGINGVDPTKKPTLPPVFGQSGCGGFTVSVCDEPTTELAYPSANIKDAMSEAKCTQYCSRMTAEYGPGCCQYGGCAEVYVGRQCGMNMCTFYKGAQDVENPYSDYPSEWRGQKWKRAMCTAGNTAAQEATYFATTSDDTALHVAVNVFAAVGFAFVFYGAYKHYFGEKN